MRITNHPPPSKRYNVVRYICYIPIKSITVYKIYT